MITTVYDDVTDCVATVNVALVWPGATVTDAGTGATEGSPLLRAIVTPAAGGGSEMRTVPTPELPPVTVVGFTPIAVSAGALVVPVTVKLRAADHAPANSPLTA